MNQQLLRLAILPLLVLLGQNGYGQIPSDLEQKFKTHITYLASDGLEGRETGTSSERVAAQYIADQFKAIGLTPGCKYNEWLYEFHFLNAKVFGANSSLKVGRSSWKPGPVYYPLLYSPSACAQGTVVNVGYGISAPLLGHDDYAGDRDLAGSIFLMELSSPDGIHPHSKFKDYSDIRTKLKVAKAHGAAGVIFMNTDSTLDNPDKDFSRKITPDSLPVVFWMGKDPKVLEGKKTKMVVEWTEEWRTGANVVGLIDNGAPLTIIIGGHYDHLGWGDEGSLFRSGRAIHNGADDNASGTGMVIELARSLKEKASRKFNYLFICFSGEEKGLLGSSAYAKDSLFKPEQVDCMINFDMVGRMDDQNYVVGINGVGTSPSWLPLVNNIHVDTMKVKTSESGVGPSDHTSFYFRDIPVLHFFSGTHADYHKPTDDEALINYRGMKDIHAYVLQLLDSIALLPELEFRKTKESEGGRSAKFSVTLGVVPDYLYSGEGLKIDGVTDGKPAAAAGMKTGDIVLQLGEHHIPDMQGYMQALGKFKKGDKVTAKVKRGEEVIELPVVF